MFISQSNPSPYKSSSLSHAATRCSLQPLLRWSRRVPVAFPDAGPWWYTLWGWRLLGRAGFPQGHGRGCPCTAFSLVLIKSNKYQPKSPGLVHWIYLGTHINESNVDQCWRAETIQCLTRAGPWMLGLPLQPAAGALSDTQRTVPGMAPSCHLK